MVYYVNYSWIKDAPYEYRPGRTGEHCFLKVSEVYADWH